jgi:two-component system chemotaxis response regulator CheB
MFDRSGKGVRIIAGDERVNYKPSVDIMFASAANVFGSKVLGIVLTGMGADGCEGARLIKGRGGQIWGQDEGSSVVYGMPAAIAKAGLTDVVLPIEEFAEQLTNKFC